MYTNSMANVVTCLIAVTLCLTNALVWAFVSDMPLIGMGWAAGAGVCVKMQTWSRQ